MPLWLVSRVLTRTPRRPPCNLPSFENCCQLDESTVMRLMPQADPEARAEIQGAMVEGAVDRRDFDRALFLLNQIPSDQDYPYVAATQLILRLPAGHEAEKRAILVNAMAHDREHSSLGGEGDCSAVNCAAGDLSG